MAESLTISAPGDITILRNKIGRFTGLAAIVSAVISGYNFINWWYGQAPPTPSVGLLFGALTGVLVLATVLLLRPPMAGLTVLREPFKTAPITWIAVLAGLAALIFLGYYGREADRIDLKVSVHAQFILFAGGALALLYGFGVFTGVTRRTISAYVKGLPRIRVGLLLAIILVGFIVRAYRLGDLVHAPIDEDHYYFGVLDLINLPNNAIFNQIGGLASLPHLLPYFQLWFMGIFGGALDSMRIPTMIFGVLTIPAVYLLGCALFDWQIGILSAAFLAVFPPHINFSRLAVFNIPDTFFGVLALACLAFGFRHNRQRDFVLAGVFLALSGLFYEGGRLLYFGLAAIFIIYNLLTGGTLRRSWRALAMMAVCYVAVSVPYLAIIMFRENLYFLPRLSMEGVRLGFMVRDIEAGSPVLDVLQKHWDDALQKTFYHTLYWPDGSRYYYGGTTGILLWYMIPFYFLGLFYAAFRAIRSGLILWVWLIGAMIGISLVTSTDWTVRFGVMFPVMAILVAVGLRYVPELIWPTTVDKRLLWGVLGAAVVVGGAVNINYYFNVHLPILNAQFRYLDYDPPRMDFYDAFYTVSFDKNATLYFLGIDPQTIYNPVIDHEIALRQLDLQWEVDGDASKITTDWLKALPRNRELALVIDPTAKNLVDELKTAFPDATGPVPGLVDTVPERARYLIYRVPPQP